MDFADLEQFSNAKIYDVGMGKTSLYLQGIYRDLPLNQISSPLDQVLTELSSARATTREYDHVISSLLQYIARRTMGKIGNEAFPEDQKVSAQMLKNIVKTVIYIPCYTTLASQSAHFLLDHGYVIGLKFLLLLCRRDGVQLNLTEVLPRTIRSDVPEDKLTSIMKSI